MHLHLHLHLQLMLDAMSMLYMPERREQSREQVEALVGWCKNTADRWVLSIWACVSLLGLGLKVWSGAGAGARAGCAIMQLLGPLLHAEAPRTCSLPDKQLVLAGSWVAWQCLGRLS